MTASENIITAAIGVVLIGSYLASGHFVELALVAGVSLLLGIAA